MSSDVPDTQQVVPVETPSDYTDDDATVIPPGSIETVPPTLAGDWLDDDAAYRDALVESEAEPPTPAELPRTAAPTMPAPERRRNARLIAETRTYPVETKCVRLVPEDARRRSISISSPTGALLISDQEIYAESTAFYLPSFGGDITLDDYTGPLYAAPYGTPGAPWSVSYAAVTE